MITPIDGEVFAAVGPRIVEETKDALLCDIGPNFVKECKAAFCGSYTYVLSSPISKCGFLFSLSVKSSSQRAVTPYRSTIISVLSKWPKNRLVGNLASGCVRDG